MSEFGSQMGADSGRGLPASTQEHVYRQPGRERRILGGRLATAARACRGKDEVASLGQGLQTASRVPGTNRRRRAGRSWRRRPSRGNARPALGAKELVCPPPHYGTSSLAHVHLLLSAARRCAASTRGGRCATGLCALI